MKSYEVLLKHFQAVLYVYKFSNDLNLSLYENENERVFQNRCTHIHATKHVMIQLQNRKFLNFLSVGG